MTQLLPTRVAGHAGARPDHPAVIGEDETLPYSQLEARSSALARGLLARGFRPGMRIAFLLGNEPMTLVAWLGILKAGGSAVALPQGVAADALRRIIDDCRPQFVVVDKELDLARALWPERAPAWRAALVLVSCDGEEIAALGSLFEESTRTLPEIGPADEFNIIYSSGTTSAPKGIVHTHGIRVARVDMLIQSGCFDEHARVLLTLPLYTNWSAIALVTTLCAGGTIVLNRHFSVEQYLLTLSVQRVTHSFIVPAQLTRLLDWADFETAVAGTSTIKYCAGAPLSASRKREAVARWPGPFLEIYGMTEGAATTLLNANENPDKLDSVGRPAFQSACYILDADGSVLPPGEVGEIAGSSAASMVGYYNRPDLTSAIRWMAPDGTACYRSGDLGWMDTDGFLHVSGRAKDMIVSGGMNIYAADLEDVVATHPEVAEAAVIGVPSVQWGETPIAVIVAKPGRTPDAEAIRQWANARLGKFQRISRVEICSALPRGQMDKVAKKELQLLFAQVRQA